MIAAVKRAGELTIFYGNGGKRFSDEYKGIESQEITVFDMFRGTLNHSQPIFVASCSRE